MAKTAIKLENVTKVFPGVRALNNVSFEIKEGDVHCIIGENGAGKSTMIKILAGVQGCDGGHVELFGQKVNFKSPEDAKKAGGTVRRTEADGTSDSWCALLLGTER